MLTRERSQKFKVMKFEILGVTKMADFMWQIFCQFPPGKIGLKFVTENFTTFFTARKKLGTWNSLWEHPLQEIIR